VTESPAVPAAPDTKTDSNEPPDATPAAAESGGSDSTVVAPDSFLFLKMKQRTQRKTKVITNNNRNSSVQEHPPQRQSQPVLSRVLRFVNTASVQVEFQVNSFDLICALGVIPITSSTAYAICKSVKLKRVQIWAAPKSDSDSAHKEAFVDWDTNTSFGCSKRVSDVSMSNAHPLYIDTKPPKEGVSSFWSYGNPVVNLATVSVPTAAVVDVTVNFTMADRSMLLQTISLFFTVGQISYAKLDQSGTAALMPVGLQNQP
jgi:hypothetical protein